MAGLTPGWLTKALDEHVPGWRKDTKCPVCKKKIRNLGFRRHLETVHGINTPKN